MYFLTGQCSSDKGKLKPGSGILTYRGSRYNCTLEGCEGVKVFCTMHPAFVLRAWGFNPLFLVDLTHAIEDSHYPELRLPEYEEHISPDRSTCSLLVDEAMSSGRISLDIETFPGGRYSCIGFSFRRQEKDIGVCVTYKQPYLVQLLRDLWESPTSKIFQYGTYDISFMEHFYGWKIGGYYDNMGWDTYIASASILPDFPRGLDFLTSIYTRFQYYKTERKVWKEKGDMSILWKYNIKDCIATYQIAMEQMKEIKELFG